MDDKNAVSPVPPAADPAAPADPKKQAAKKPEIGGPAKPPETGGPEGPEPTRYGDWERGGRCVDF
jgi:hypothetical protein